LKTGLNILICPLEWGLGHAARMIPVAKKLGEMKNNVFIASGKEHISLFHKELPELTCIMFPGFKPGYSRFLPQYLYLLFKLPELLYHIIREHFRLKTILEKYAIDIIISDNRFGLWNSNVTSVYITHQPLIPFPKSFRFLEFLGVLIHRAVIKKYSLCFIPDLAGDLNLTGRLSHGLKLPENTRYIGILSRFSDIGLSVIDDTVNIHHNTVILSGPDPQREILKHKLIALLRDKKPATIILEGKPGNKEEITYNGNITFYNHLPAQKMKELIESSDCVISRSGYTTIMELVSLNCSALIIPTPGQTEQEYLAEYLSEKGWFCTIKQQEIKNGLSFPPQKTLLHGEIIRESGILMNKALNEMLEKHHKER
jgi:UDP-N-acetylglucosamine transferase subunit ALG13